MTSASPDLENRIEDSLAGVFKDAFPGVPIHSLTSPGERSGKCIGIKAESGSENPIGTNLFDVAIEIEAQGLNSTERHLLSEMVGNANAAKQTLEIHSSRQFAMPRGQAVEMIGAPRTVETEAGLIVTYSLSASIQPI